MSAVALAASGEEAVVGHLPGLILVDGCDVDDGVTGVDERRPVDADDDPGPVGMHEPHAAAQGVADPAEPPALLDEVAELDVCLEDAAPPGADPAARARDDGRGSG